jgi:hypothetical protein
LGLPTTKLSNVKRGSSGEESWTGSRAASPGGVGAAGCGRATSTVARGARADSDSTKNCTSFTSGHSCAHSSRMRSP